jgi:hypothetical protein
MARQMQSICRHNQNESLWNSDLVGYFQRSAGYRKVADQTINPASAEPDGSGFQHPVSRCSATFGHEIEVRQNPKESIKPNDNSAGQAAPAKERNAPTVISSASEIDFLEITGAARQD